MPVDVTWPRPDTIMMNIVGEWSAEEWLDAFARITSEVLSKGERVFLVYNFETTYTPRGVLSHLVRLGDASKELVSSGLLIEKYVVGQTPFMRRASDIYIAVFKPQGLVFVDTLEEVWPLLEQARHTIS